MIHTLLILDRTRVWYLKNEATHVHYTDWTHQRSGQVPSLCILYRWASGVMWYDIDPCNNYEVEQIHYVIIITWRAMYYVINMHQTTRYDHKRKPLCTVMYDTIESDRGKVYCRSVWMSSTCMNVLAMEFGIDNSWYDYKLTVGIHCLLLSKDVIEVPL